MSPEQPKYRPDIDGLRALAVLSVVAYHAFPKILPGGFVGVDVFFVISGYLISNIILGSLAENRFSFRKFYARRVKRIFPALALVLLVCLVAGWFLLLPDEYSALGTHVAGGAGFVSNLVLWGESAYFDKAAEVKPLLHLWSLGIEEQFYIFWPLLLFVAWKNRARFPWILGALISASFLFCFLKTYVDSVAAFYSPFSRLWELGIGGALAYSTTFHADRRHSVVNNVANGLPRAAVGMVLIGLAVVLLSPRSAFPGVVALLPAVGTVLLISAGPDTWINRNLLSSRVLVFIGLISYPLYLWHWPLLTLARIGGSGSISVAVRMQLILLSFVLATLTYVVLERPIRFGQHSLAKVVLLVTIMAGIGYAGHYVFKQNGFTARIPNLILRTPRTIEEARSARLIGEYITLKYDPAADGRVGTCWLHASDSPEQYAKECSGAAEGAATNAPLVLVWGDSHAGRLSAGLRNIIGKESRVAEFTRDSCPPVLDYGYKKCRVSNAYIMEKVRAIKPDTIVMFAVWNRYCGWNEGDDCSGKLLRTIAELKKTGAAKIVVIGPVPQWEIDLPHNLFNIFRSDVHHRVPLRTATGLVNAVQSTDVAMAKLVGSRDGVIYVSGFNEFCNENGCLTRVNEAADGLTTWDYGHLTTASAEYLTRRLPLNR